MPLQMHIAARNAVVQFLHHAGTHQISACNSEVQFVYRAGARPVCACNSEVQFLPCRHKPFVPQMNRRYKISTVLAKPYISGRRAEIQVPLQIQIAAYESEVQQCTVLVQTRWLLGTPRYNCAPGGCIFAPLHIESGVQIGIVDGKTDCLQRLLLINRADAKPPMGRGRRMSAFDLTSGSCRPTKPADMTVTR